MIYEIALQDLHGIQSTTNTVANVTIWTVILKTSVTTVRTIVATFTAWQNTTKLMLMLMNIMAETITVLPVMISTRS